MINYVDNEFINVYKLGLIGTCVKGFQNESAEKGSVAGPYVTTDAKWPGTRDNKTPKFLDRNFLFGGRTNDFSKLPLGGADDCMRA